MVDNFELIANNFLPKESDEKHFHHLQILRRGKDNPDAAKNVLIKEYFIESKDELYKLKDDIIIYCQAFNARAYISLTPKDYMDVLKLMAFRCSERVYTGDAKKPQKIFSRCCEEAKAHFPYTNYWIVDIDDTNNIEDCNQYIDTIINIIAEQKDREGFVTKMPSREVAKHLIHGIIPTRSGFHIITSPFNMQKFSEIYPNIDVHKNNPTILWCN